MNDKFLSLRDLLWRQLSAIKLRDWLPSRGNVLFTLLVVCCLVGTSRVWAAPQSAPAQAGTSTSTIPYQGRLADASGAPLTGTYILTFRLYNVASGGSPLWEEIWIGANNVQVTNGLFNVMLGSITPIPQSLFTGNSSLWLGVDVGTDAEMTPRVQLGSVPYAILAQTVPDGAVTSAKLDTNLTLSGAFSAGSLNANSYFVGGSEGKIAQVLTVDGAGKGPFTVTLPTLPWAGLVVLSFHFYGQSSGALIWVNTGNVSCNGYDSCATATIVAGSGGATGGNACNISSVSISPGSDQLTITSNGNAGGCLVANKKAYAIGN